MKTPRLIAAAITVGLALVGCGLVHAEVCECAWGEPDCPTIEVESSPDWNDHGPFDCYGTTETTKTFTITATPSTPSRYIELLVVVIEKLRVYPPHEDWTSVFTDYWYDPVWELEYTFDEPGEYRIIVDAYEVFPGGGGNRHTHCTDYPHIIFDQKLYYAFRWLGAKGALHDCEPDAAYYSQFNPCHWEPYRLSAFDLELPANNPANTEYIEDWIAPGGPGQDHTIGECLGFMWYNFDALRTDHFCVFGHHKSQDENRLGHTYENDATGARYPVIFADRIDSYRYPYREQPSLHEPARHCVWPRYAPPMVGQHCPMPQCISFQEAAGQQALCNNLIPSAYCRRNIAPGSYLDLAEVYIPPPPLPPQW